MRRLHLVRHAPVVVDFAVPAREWPLAPAAEPLVRRLAKRLAGTGLRRVVSSPEAKAVGTARLLAETLGLSAEIRDGLEEHHRLLEQQSRDRAVFEANIRRLFDRPADLTFGTESAQEALDRFRSAVEAIMAESDGDELVVSHGTVISLLAASCGGSAFDIWSSLRMPDMVSLEWPRLRRVAY